MNVRFRLPTAICRASAWMISGLFRSRWKLTSTSRDAAIGRAQGIERTDGRQRIVGARIDAGAVVLAVQLQALVDIPDDQPPVLVAAHLGDFGQGVVVLVGLDPQAGKAGGDVFGQTSRE